MHGGSHKVTENREWKRIATYFDFPATCTNSAFVLKRIYVEADLENFTYDPSKQVPYTPNAKRERLADSDSSTSSDEEPSSTKKLARSPIEKKKLGSFIPPAAVSQPVGHPHLAKGSKSRIALALQSMIPNEVEWALKELVTISLNAENVRLDKLPMLMDSLVAIGIKNLEDLKFQDAVGNDTLRIHVKMLGLHGEKYMQVMDSLAKVVLIMRNLSFNPFNLRHMLKIKPLLAVLLEAFDNPLIQEELHKDVLEIIDSIAIYYKDVDNPRLFKFIYSYADSNDLYLSLLSYQILTKISFDTFNSQLITTLPTPVILHALNLLLLQSSKTSIVLNFLSFYMETVTKCQVDFPIKPQVFIKRILSVSCMYAKSSENKTIQDPNASW
jgi:hypothetical protein